MNKIVSNLRAKTGPQHLFEYNLQNVVKTNNNNKKNICILKWCSFEFIISFMLSGDDFLSNSGIIRLSSSSSSS